MNISIAKNYSYPDFSNLSQEILEQRFKVSQEEKDFINLYKKANKVAKNIKTDAIKKYSITMPLVCQ